MTTLFCGGGFDGFLTAVFEAYRRGIETDCAIRRAGGGAVMTLGPSEEISPDPVRAGRVERKLKALGMVRTLSLAWLSGEELEDEMLACVVRGIREGRAPWADRSSRPVGRVTAAADRVRLEAHRYVEFLRFRRVFEDPPVYLSDIEPLYDILPLIAGHFTRRFPSQLFLIREQGFGRTLVWDGREAVISDDPALFRLSAEDRGDAAGMWRAYFESVAIPWRKNKKLQAHFVPLRFRGRLTEFGAE